MRQRVLFILSLLLLSSCAQKDPEEEVKDLDRMVFYPSLKKVKKEDMDPSEEQIKTVKNNSGY